MHQVGMVNNRKPQKAMYVYQNHDLSHRIELLALDCCNHDAMHARVLSISFSLRIFWFYMIIAYFIYSHMIIIMLIRLYPIKKGNRDTCIALAHSSERGGELVGGTDNQVNPGSYILDTTLTSFFF